MTKYLKNVLNYKCGSLSNGGMDTTIVSTSKTMYDGVEVGGGGYIYTEVVCIEQKLYERGDSYITTTIKRY